MKNIFFYNKIYKLKFGLNPDSRFCLDGDLNRPTNSVRIEKKYIFPILARKLLIIQ